MTKISSSNNGRDMVLNPNNDRFWKCRNWNERPRDWEHRISTGHILPSQHKQGVKK